MIGAPSTTALRTKPIIGWRAWYVYDRYVFRDAHDAPYLGSVAIPTAWPRAAALVAHASPLREREAGIHAYRSLAHAWDEFSSSWGGDLVLGSVALWGMTVEHELGYRAQYGYPQELLLPLEPWDPWGPWADPETVRALARVYGCEVRPLADILGTDLNLTGMTIDAMSSWFRIPVDDGWYLGFVFDRRRNPSLDLEQVGRQAVAITHHRYIHLEPGCGDGAVAVVIPEQRAVAVFAGDVVGNGTGAARILRAALGEWAVPYASDAAHGARAKLARAMITHYARAHVRAANETGAPS